MKRQNDSADSAPQRSTKRQNDTADSAPQRSTKRQSDTAGSPAWRPTRYAQAFEDSRQVWREILDACVRGGVADLERLLVVGKIDQFFVWQLDFLADRLEAGEFAADDCMQKAELARAFFESTSQMGGCLFEEALQAHLPVQIIDRMLFAGACRHLDREGREDVLVSAHHCACAPDVIARLERFLEELD